MRILHITPSYWPAIRYGGPIYSVHALARSLAERGHDVHAYTTNIDGRTVSDVPVDVPVDRDGVSVTYFASGFGRRLFRAPKMARALAENIGTFDIVHLNSVYLWPTFVGARAARRASVPYMISPRGMLVRELIARKSYWRKTAWINAIERRNLAGAAGIHVTSAYERKALEDIGLALAPVTVVPIGVERPPPSRADVISQDVAEAIGAGFDALVFGRMSWKKGLDRVIAALGHAPGIRVLIAGNDDDRYMPALLRQAVDMGVADRVRFLPRQIEGDDKEALFAAAKLLVLPSISENFGIVILEAMIRGLPVLTTEDVGAAEMVRVGGAGIQTAADPPALGSALADALRMPDRLRAMGEAGRNYALSYLSWDSVVTAMEAVYSTAISQAGRAPAR